MTLEIPETLQQVSPDHKTFNRWKEPSVKIAPSFLLLIRPAALAASPESRTETQNSLVTQNGIGIYANRATVDQVTVLNEICHANPNSIHAFLDIQTAYDTVDRRILWSTLMNQFGIPLGLVRELAKLMEGNQVKVLLGKDVGISLSATRGLLQGSTLSPLLFNFFYQRTHQKTPREWPLG